MGIENMDMVINLNGRICTPEVAKISIFDHGFLFGDSVYEVVRTYGRHPFALEEHIQRMEKSASQIQLSLGIQREEWKNRIYQSLEHFSGKEAYIRMIVTRGPGEITLDPSVCSSPNHIIIVKALEEYPPEYFSEGVHIVFVSTRRNSRKALSPQIKSGNYLNNVLAYMEAKKQGAIEGIMLNSQGEVTEGTTSNIFLVRHGKVETPALECGILEGITRKNIFLLGKSLAIPIVESRLLPQDFYESDEVFITSTTKEIMPVKSIGEKIFQGPGPITQKLQGAFQKMVANFLKHHS